MSIRILPPSVATRIAAGEVVTRPADVVKELVENALDAGAQRIEVELARGGLDLLAVRDDGCGIPAAEVALAFERHATSKLRLAEDLDRIASLGFRGEALPSIAAVSHTTLTTRATGKAVGTVIALAGGRVEHVEERAWPGGTAVVVRHLFFNAPARLRFLHSASAEGSQAARLVHLFALAYPEVAFTLRQDGQVTFESGGSGDLRAVLAQLYGPEVARALRDVALAGDSVAIAGLASPPTLARATRSHQFLFVNGRAVRSRALQHAIERAYRTVLPGGQHPIAVLALRVPPDEVDVNVHPQKWEVRFRRERLVFARVLDALHQALAEAAPAVKSLGPPEHETATDGAPVAQAVFPWRVAPAPPEAEDEARDGLPPLRVLGQTGALFIVCEGPQGLYLVDQHRAHERVLFERLMAEAQGAGQALLEPEVVDLSPTQVDALPAVLAELARVGFRVETFGPQAVLVRTVPSLLAGGRVGPALAEALDLAVGADDVERWRERAYAALSCRSAVKRGQVLSREEMRELVLQLEATALPQTCPHGAPAILHLSQNQLERHFLRR
ncbi:MAG: DNA mismatch repair endonuclease MutL [Chloroflexi bacterium]|nr:DNA mismatch repair endonuclease MutL [Chloroflexota bacterium]